MLEVIAAEVDVMATATELAVQIPQMQQVVRAGQHVRGIGRVRQRPEPLEPLFNPAASQRVGIVEREGEWAAPDQDALEQAQQIGHAGDAWRRLQEGVAGEVIGSDLVPDERLMQRRQSSPLIISGTRRCMIDPWTLLPPRPLPSPEGRYPSVCAR